MSKRNIVGLILIIISLICLYPGLTLPILNIHIGASVPMLGEFELYDRTQSVISGIKLLYEFDNTLVATLILIFSVLVPITKALLLFAVMAFKNWKSRIKVYSFVAIIGKWSMADVFVVGIFLFYLATASEEGIRASIHEGFYYFTAYCLISILSIQVLDVKEVKQSKDQVIF
ncbi:paraquat-inducible protein A [Roseivirga pacifica]|uniref:paraquat-inducible protein A n=1 Tax=Roseivirga pacifica TaxID=1267423 RepID=UPI003BA95398